MSPLTCSLLALACAALFVCARAEQFDEGNNACATLIKGDTETKFTTAVTLPERHIRGPDEVVTSPNVIKKGQALVGIKYVACDFLTGKKPTIKLDKSTALKATISCDKQKPRCRVGLQMQVTEYGIKVLTESLK